MNPLEQENKTLKRTLHVLISKAERNRDILAGFQEMELRLLACNTLQDLLNELLVTLKDYFRLDAVTLVLFDPEQAARTLLADRTESNPHPNLRFTETYAELKQLHSQISRVVVGTHSDEARAYAFPDNPYILSSALMPLTRHNILIGSLHLGSRDPQRYSHHVATDYITHMASVISVCVENCINQETLRRLSIIDMLTRVHNRRSFDQELLKELSRATRNKAPLSCLFLDLDHFKRINDTHGHQTGDRVLREAAKLIKSQLRKTDLIARYGGEEFAALLPGCDPERASQVAETIRAAIAEHLFTSEDGDAVPLTVSIGVSTAPPQGNGKIVFSDVASHLLACADEAVYLAKRNGRDQLIYQPFAEQYAPVLNNMNPAG